MSAKDKSYKPSGKRTRRPEDEDDEVEEDESDESNESGEENRNGMSVDEMVKFSAMAGEKAKAPTALAHYRRLGESGLRVSPCLFFFFFHISLFFFL